MFNGLQVIDAYIAIIQEFYSFMYFPFLCVTCELKKQFVILC